ncbi:MAG: FMN-binding protein [Roseburia sp.]|nr:FMN-binding protein [Roseburia sp.]
MGKRKLVLIFFALTLTLGGCGHKQSKGMQDGTYTAQMSDYAFGWKEYVTITVNNGEITATEYNAENASGFIKSWDNAYMNNMKSVTGTYPNEYTRYYAAQLTGQNALPEIDTLSGASTSGNNFKKLARSVVEQAIKGDSTIVYVKSEPETALEN